MSPIEKRFVFHVGAHQSGSALLQKYLADNAGLLRAGGLYCMPRGVLQRHIGRGEKLVTDRETFAGMVRHTLAKRRIHAVIASHENTIGDPFQEGGGGLYPASGAAVRALADVARSYRSTIVLSVRPQADFVESYYLQAVNQGATATFAEWLAKLDLDDISWLPLHDRLVAEFGSEAVRVLDFRGAARGRATYLRNFLRLVEVDVPIGDEDPPVSKPGTSDKGLRIALAANPYLRTGAERASMRRFLQTRFAGRGNPPPVLLTDDQRAQVDNRYQAEYQQLVGGAHAKARL